MTAIAWRLAAILASALLFGLYTRVELPWAWLGWIALVPWLAALDRERRMVAVLASSTVMSMAFTGTVFAWIAAAVARYTQVPPWLAYGLLLVAAPVLQPQFLVFAAARHALVRRAGNRLAVDVAAALAWAGAEWVFPHILGDTIGQGLLPFATMRQGADLAGALGLTFVVVLVNQRLYAAVVGLPVSPRRGLRALATAVVLVAALAGYGAFRLRRLATLEPSSTLTAVLVQANLHDYAGLRERLGTFGATERILATHMSLSMHELDAILPSGRVDLVVWPETVYPTTFGTPKSEAGKELDSEIERFVERTHAPLLFGTYDRDDDGEYNAAVLLQPSTDGAPSMEVYRKRRLFPLTEEVPAWLDSTRLRAQLPWLGTWRSGDGPALLTLRRGRVEMPLAPLICLDDVDPELALDAARRGAALIVTLSNDGWFAGGGGARLHLTVAAFRSIETRLPQLRATNTGISAVIGSDGGIVARAGVDESAALVATVHPGRREPTAMRRLGDWFGPAACFLAPVFGLLALRSRAA